MGINSDRKLSVLSFMSRGRLQACKKTASSTYRYEVSVENIKRVDFD